MIKYSVTLLFSTSLLVANTNNKGLNSQVKEVKEKELLMIKS